MPVVKQLLRHVAAACALAATAALAKGPATPAPGDVRPVAEARATVSHLVPGEIIAVDLVPEAGHWVYVVLVLTHEGRRREVRLNALTLTRPNGN